jgi:hypothetical protein
LCFIWCILAYIYPALNNPNRVSQYKKHFKSINLNGLEHISKTGVDFKDAELFCQNNNQSINIWWLIIDKNDEEKSKCKFEMAFKHTIFNEKPIINLLFYNGHYSLIKDLSTLFANINGLKEKVILYLFIY